ncbi:Retrovirus-related Pol polyprotein from transposon RE1 [Bienertia sinuspersici]
MEKLQGFSNYRPWKRSFELALASKRKLGFITGAVERDNVDKVKQEAWDTCNSMVISWILANVFDAIKKSIMYSGSAKQIWKQLEQRYQVSSCSRRYQLNKMLYETKQMGRSVTDYYTEMCSLWEELESLTDMPPVTKWNEEIGAYIAALHKYQDEQRLFQFLNGLDEVYNTQRSNVLMRTPLPPIEEACCAVQQEESQREILK